MVWNSHLLLGVAVIAGLSLAGPPAARSADVAFGRRVAERYCGGCHAIGAGRSPNPRSPPFRRLYRRYRTGGLDALLAEGMVAPTTPAEEGAAPLHPSMPQVSLGEDEVAALKAYLRSLEPRRRARAGRPQASATGSH